MNLIPTIREALGLEMNEEFQIKDETGKLGVCNYRFTDVEIQRGLSKGSWERAGNILLAMLVMGEREVVKLPFKPKQNEDYYFVDVSTGYVCRTTFEYSRDVLRRREMLRISSGNCYQTEEEAENHVDEWMEKLYGKEWRELLK